MKYAQNRGTQVRSVINYDLPTGPDGYHRRVGRIGASGHKPVVISFVSPQQKAELEAVGKSMELSIEELPPDASGLF